MRLRLPVGLQEGRRIKAFEMFCDRKMLWIKSTDKVRNEEVIKRIGRDEQMWSMIAGRIIKTI